MLSIRNLLVSSLLAGCILAQQTTPIPAQDGLHAETAAFHHIVTQLPEGPLHAALKQEVAPEYQDGVWEKAAEAAKAVHRTNARLASKVIAAARYELIRRQAGNGTTTSRPPPPVITSPAPTVSNGQVVVTSTNAQGSTVVATFIPSNGVISSVVLRTTTLPNGQVSTSTSFAIVAASRTSSSTGTPGLQGNAASGLREKNGFGLEIVAFIVASLGFGFFLL